MDDNPRSPETAKGDDAVALIDSMRANGSFDQARQRLNATAKVIGDRITAAVQNQTWRFTSDPNLRKISSEGMSCDKLAGDVARRPKADTVEFSRTFTADEFALAAGIVREEAAQYGATAESSIFNEASKRDYDVQGNGYEFRLGQIDFARLNITGDCFLLKP
jgi:hypothetical protein